MTFSARQQGLRIGRVAFAILFFGACSTNQEEFRLNNLVETEGREIPQTNAKSEAKLLKLQAGKQVEWFECRAGKSSKKAAFLINGSSPFVSEGHCKSPLAQSFLSQGYQVVAINRSGFGQSNWVDDWGGDESLQVMETLWGKLPYKIDGIWSEAEGTILASRLAKKHDLTWVVLGNGIYDLEIFSELSKNSSHQESIEIIKKKEGDQAFEKRSISWDFEGFPKFVYLYQGEGLDGFRKEQGQEFMNGLAAAGHRTALKTVKTKTGDLTENDHGLIVISAMKHFSIGETSAK
ncbi:alpha/beta hydrolase family protein [Pseudobacteriovorax antillogorgiicola]|uniref:Alpha/beta hydrolase family protein n=1 Tax=Pseudobacteriovorax antillogorgiicola TaxID=1513793 RepID=A0A1Y6B2K1_9BACT|nr:hypothetical protein [Pseudobacteriovorax antillogorgiicola]TCS59458.1 hypothetical protein EDD56_101370 [Pseudobacteriovorax antillogorgiicola]SME88173.1 hypothetical protein SAMN06296036_101115 [Pseudobacteriovorax antillogorgiicola]